MFGGLERGEVAACVCHTPCAGSPRSANFCRHASWHPSCEVTLDASDANTLPARWWWASVSKQARLLAARCWSRPSGSGWARSCRVARRVCGMEGDQQVWGWRRGQGSPSHLGRSAIGGGQSLCFCLPVFLLVRWCARKARVAAKPAGRRMQKSCDWLSRRTCSSTPPALHTCSLLARGE